MHVCVQLHRGERPWAPVEAWGQGWTRERHRGLAAEGSLKVHLHVARAGDPGPGAGVMQAGPCRGSNLSSDRLRGGRSRTPPPARGDSCRTPTPTQGPGGDFASWQGGWGGGAGDRSRGSLLGPASSAPGPTLLEVERPRQPSPIRCWFFTFAPVLFVASPLQPPPQPPSGFPAPPGALPGPHS